MRPLEGTLVLDFSTLLPGPMASLLLAEAGAEVVKIERPGSGDEMRGYEPQVGGMSANFALLNRGKKSVALDLKDPEARCRLEPWLVRADVLIEQFRPGVMDRLGLSFDAVRSLNPRIIYCSITGYGQTGPHRHVAGHDLNYLAETGLLALSRGSTAHPVLPPALIADIAGGAYPAVINILLALLARGRDDGTARHLDISMSDNLFPFLYWALGQGAATGHWPGNGDSLVTGGTARYRLYSTSDGGIIAAAPIEDRFWAAFCDAMGLDDTFRDDKRDPAATIAEIARLIGSRTTSYWQHVFARADCCCCPVASLQDALDNPHFLARGLFEPNIRTPDGTTLPALPVPIEASFRRNVNELPTPALGKHNEIMFGCLPE